MSGKGTTTKCSALDLEAALSALGNCSDAESEALALMFYKLPAAFKDLYPSRDTGWGLIIPCQQPLRLTLDDLESAGCMPGGLANRTIFAFHDSELAFRHLLRANV